MSQGKRLRPILVIVSAEAVGGRREDVMSLALAFELFHTATLVHDDIIDQDDLRRDLPALHKRWSVNDAILAGDALIALSIGLASQYGEEVLKVVSESALQICDGEYLETSLARNLTNEEIYYRVVQRKSASLFKAAAHCGALVGGGKPAEVLSLGGFGQSFGIAYQLRDDLLDLESSLESIPGEGKIPLTLPLIRLRETSGGDQLEGLLDSLVAGHRGSAETVKAILRMMKEYGVDNYCRNSFRQHLQGSIDCLSPLRESRSKRLLVKMAKSLENTV